MSFRPTNGCLCKPVTWGVTLSFIGKKLVIAHLRGMTMRSAVDAQPYSLNPARPEMRRRTGKPQIWNNAPSKLVSMLSLNPSSHGIGQIIKQMHGAICGWPHARNIAGYHSYPVLEVPALFGNSPNTTSFPSTGWSSIANNGLSLQSTNLIYVRGHGCPA